MSEKPESGAVEETEATTGQEPNGADPDSMDISDLGSLINSTEVPAEPVEEIVEDVAEEKTEEVAAEPEEEVEAKPETQEEDEQEPGEPDPLDEIRLRLEIAESETKRFEKLLGRATGSEGFLKRKMSDLEADNERLRRQLDSGETGEPEAAPRHVEPKSDAVSAWAVQQAINEAGRQFAQVHAGEAELLEDMKNRIESSGADVAAMLETGDPVYASQEASSLLERFYLEAKRDSMAAKRVEMERRKVDQAEQLKKKKRAAAVSTSSGADASPPTKPAFNPDTAPMDDLRKLIEANRPEQIG